MLYLPGWQKDNVSDGCQLLDIDISVTLATRRVGKIKYSHLQEPNC